MSAPRPPGGPAWGTPPTTTPGARLRTARLRRRRLLLGVTAPLMLVALVLGFKLAFLPVMASFALSSYEEGDFRRAASVYGSQRTLNIVEPWKAHFNTGTANLQDGAYYDAITSLRVAYDHAVDAEPMVRCTIQTNMSLAYEDMGDSDMEYAEQVSAELEAVETALDAREAGLPYDERVLDPYGDGTEPDPDELRDRTQDWFEYAEQAYASAEQIRGWPDCEDQSEEEQEQNESALDRLEDKSQEARDSQPENDEQEEQDEEQKQDEQPDGGQSEEERAEAERQEQLEQQNSEARDEEDQLQQMLEELYGGGEGDEPGGGGGDWTPSW
ncbi:hypothetical protein [Oerskovia flava]|uniref:hypothetical protein n=1 Tax=Oerskovia flava TaxID=2986422 RepID=UPI00223F9217|nr:hypothetical protein [Oerskovia sp. JB1-3-2]